MSNFAWRRPSSVEQSLIYSIFESFDTFGEKVTYRIEDLSEEKFDSAIEVLRENYFDDDLMMRSKKVKEDPISVDEVTQYWRKIMEQKVSLACYQEGSSDIVALSLLGVISESEFDAYTPNGENWSEIIKVRKFIKDILFNPFECYHVDKIMTEECFYVNRNHACVDIEAEVIKAKVTMGKVFSVSTFSSFYSKSIYQKVALDCGYDENFSMQFKKLPKYLCEGFFPGIQEETLKVLSVKFY